MIKKILACISLTACLIFFTVGNAYAERSYGPVKPKDYLGVIVRKAYPKTKLKSQQIMVAILRANPKAFKGKNIHSIKLGAMLDLPSEDIIKTINNKKAIKLINEHHALFKKGKKGNIVLEPLPKSGNVSEKSKSAKTVVKTDKKSPEATTDTVKADEKSSKTTESAEDTVKADEKSPKTATDNAEDSAKSDEKSPETASDNAEDTAKSDEKSLETASDNAEDSAKSDEKSPETVSDNAEDSAKSDEKSPETASDNVEDTAKSDEKSPETTPTADIIDNPDLGINDKKILADKSTNQTYGKLDSLEGIREQQNKTINLLDQQIAALQDQVDHKKPANRDNAVKDEALKEDVVIVTPTDTEANEPSATDDKTATENNEKAATISTDIATQQGVNDLEGFNSFDKPWQLAILFGTLGLLALVTYRAFKKPNKQDKIGIPLTRTAVTAKERVLTNDKLLDPVIKREATLNTAIASSQVDKAQAIDQAHEDVDLKINMAKAYIDMGYTKAATDVLKEASSESAKEQSVIINELLATIKQEPND
ncbi:MAG: hypothetical protein KAH22_10905 [Thiotrichaceae bacterium]|nr:hypothetical protein [Thiotrichaceae bacterium]